MSHSSPHHRSAPIAIHRRGSVTPRQLDSDEEDADEEAMMHDLDAMRLTAFVGSVPTKQRGFVTRNNTKISTSMPAAPRLSSSRPPLKLPTSHLLPPNCLTKAHAEGISYGSLRESHIEGRFFDGPASFRDRGSGEIRRFTESSSLMASTNHTTTGIAASRQSIGERMQSLATYSAATPERKSMLGDIMNNDSIDHRGSATSNSFGFFSAVEPTIQDYNSRHDEQASDILSTSLTGLELLTRGDLMNQFSRDTPQPIASVTACNTLTSPIRSFENGEQDDNSWSGNPDTEEVFDLDME